MTTGKSIQVPAWLIGLSCAGVLAGVLVAGLWPFRAPANEVTWLGAQHGLRFGSTGSAISANAFVAPQASDTGAGSLEVWLKPSMAKGWYTILTFEGTGHSSPFLLQQHGTTLSVRRHNLDEQGTARISVFDIEHAFRPNQPVFLTVTLADHETSVYLNGVRAGTDPLPGNSTGNFTGRLVLADDAWSSDGWPGEVLGMATYAVPLTREQVAAHYQGWTAHTPPAAAPAEMQTSRYVFDEAAGTIVHNSLNSGTDLTIPTRYTVLHPIVFLTPWREYRATREYWQDIAVNIFGLIPFGFCWMALFSQVWRWRRPLFAVTVAGFLASFTIETVQIFLPTRFSGMMDLFTNTLGTALGGLLCAFVFGQGWLRLAGGENAATAQKLERFPKMVPKAELVTSD